MRAEGAVDLAAPILLSLRRGEMSHRLPGCRRVNIGDLKIMSFRRSLALVASIIALGAVPAVAQNINGQPIYGTVTLDSGFTPDPHVIGLTSGGGRDASHLGGGCRGFVANNPDVRLHYDAGSLPLIISVASDSDTTLVINGPDGEWYCDDDSGENGLNPSVRFDRPRAGRYEIWIGSYSAGQNASARLHISELGSE